MQVNTSVRSGTKKRKVQYKRKGSLMRSRVSDSIPGSGRYDVHHHKLKNIIDVLTDSVGELRLVIDDNVTAIPDWTNLGPLYDTYKVYGIKIEYFPLIPNDDSTITSSFPPFVVTYDVDNTTFPTLVGGDVYGTLLEYSKSRSFQGNQPWSYYTRVETPTSAAVTSLGVAPSIKRGGMVDVAGAQAFSAIMIAMRYGKNDTYYGKIVVTRFVKCANRR